MSAQNPTGSELGVATALPDSITSPDPHLKQQSPLPADEAIRSNNPEPTPPPAEITQSDFGLLGAEGFRPQETKIKDRRGQETEETLQSAFEKKLSTLADRLKEYSESGKERQKIPLTAEQEGFLRLWKQKGNKLLETADGWTLGNLVLEQEMMLRLAALGKNLALDQKQIARKPLLGPDETEEVTLSTEKGLIASAQAVLNAGVFGASEVFRAIIKKDVNKLKLEDFNFNISQLPPEYQGYIKYLMPKIDAQESQKFIIECGQARSAFYEALGAKPGDLNAATPFEKFYPSLQLTPRFALTPARIEEARENLNSEWMRIRTHALEEASRGKNLRNSATANEVFFQAHLITIRHFLDKFGREIGSQMAAEKGEVTTNTITTLQKRRQKLDNPQGREELMAEKQKELTALQDDLTDSQEQIKTKTTELEEKKAEKITSEVVEHQQNLGIQENRYINTIGHDLIPAIADLQNAKSDIITNYDELINNPHTSPEDKVTYAATKTDKLTKIDARISEREADLERLRDKLGEVREEINKPAKLAARIEILEDQLDQLNTKVGKRSNAGLRGKIAKLEKEINAGVDPMVAEEQALIDTSIQTLGSYDRIIADAMSPETAKNQMISAQELGETNAKTEYNNPYPEGYLRILDHIFQYSHATDRKKVFESGQTLLPPDEIATILNESLRLGLTTPDINSALNALKTQNVPQYKMGPAFLAILDRIEEKAKSLGEPI